MAAFLKLDISTTPDSLKAASGTDYEYAVDRMLVTFAGTDTGVGTLSVNPGSTVGLTSIGTFTDTYYPYDQTQHPVGTSITSTVYTFYQDRQTATETLTRPVEFSAGAIQEQTDTSLNADLISTALANLVAVGVGSYALQPTAPVGGTWVAKATITDNLDINESNVTYLWRKTAAAAAPTTVRPVKINATSPVSVKEMSDAEIQTLTERVRNRIVATGIGSYAIQASAPVSGGTWTTSGVQFTDTSRTESDIAYNGTYAGAYIGTYNQVFAGSYTGAFTGAYTGGFTGAYAGTYQGGVARAYTPNFAGNYTRVYSGLTYYAGYGRGTNQNVSYSRVYTGFYAGAISYTGIFSRNYTGIYAGTYNQTFGGTYNRAFIGNYTGAFSGSYTGSYTGAYTGTTLNNDSANISSVYLWIRTA